MAEKPSDFLIGIGELLGILLPGATLAYVAIPALNKTATFFSLPAPEGPAGWVAFIVISYFAGHLVFLFGSFLDRPYDFIRQKFWPRERDTAFKHATQIATRALEERSSATNTYKFSTALLALYHPTAFAEVRQLEADSKFFRSLVVLGLGLLIVSLGIAEFRVATGLIVLIVMSGWRYIERRWKATQRAYQYVVVIHAVNGGSLQPNTSREGAP